MDKVMIGSRNHYKPDTPADPDLRETVKLHANLPPLMEEGEGTGSKYIQSFPRASM